MATGGRGFYCKPRPLIFCQKLCRLIDSTDSLYLFSADSNGTHAFGDELGNCFFVQFQADSGCFRRIKITVLVSHWLNDDILPVKLPVVSKVSWYNIGKKLAWAKWPYIASEASHWA